MSNTVFTIPMLMEYLHIGRNTAYQLMHRTGFPSTRLGRKWVVSEASLLEWMKNG